MRPVLDSTWKSAAGVKDFPDSLVGSVPLLHGSVKPNLVGVQHGAVGGELGLTGTLTPDGGDDNEGDQSDDGEDDDDDGCNAHGILLRR